MRFDLRSCNSAYEFVLNIMKMTPNEYNTELIINSDNSFETFWQRNIEHIANVDFSNLEIVAFHVVGSLDECEEICSNGLMNLQRVLKENTFLSRMLRKSGIVFDIDGKTFNCNGKTYDIDYEKCRSNLTLSKIDQKLDKIAHRVYYDFCVNGFLLNDNIINYGTSIHERPEFLMTLAELLPEAQELDEYWRKNSKSYIVNFFLRLNKFTDSILSWMNGGTRLMMVGMI